MFQPSPVRVSFVQYSHLIGANTIRTAQQAGGSGRQTGRQAGRYTKYVCTEELTDCLLTGLPSGAPPSSVSLAERVSIFSSARESAGRAATPNEKAAMCRSSSSKLRVGWLNGHHQQHSTLMGKGCSHVSY